MPDLYDIKWLLVQEGVKTAVPQPPSPSDSSPDDPEVKRGQVAL